MKRRDCNSIKWIALFACLGLGSFRPWAGGPHQGDSTILYPELIEAYTGLAGSHGNARLMEIGVSDHGEPIHLFVIGDTSGLNAEKADRRAVVLINNGIHPGESCGVDASLHLARHILSGELHLDTSRLLIAIIPMYNVGGAHNRRCCTRANQDGPVSQGFRGNARNLDLNRDFVKMESLNSRAFAKAFHWLRPDFFVDTHTSNGADYQHTMTLISTMRQGLSTDKAGYLDVIVEPMLYEEMESAGWPMVPYMHTLGSTPFDGIAQFHDSPRYSTGFTAMFDCIGFVTETHMLKPYEERVNSTYDFLRILIKEAWQFKLGLTSMEELARDAPPGLEGMREWLNMEISVGIDFILDTTVVREMKYLGYHAAYLPSEMFSGDRLYYDRARQVDTLISYFPDYRPMITRRVPVKFIIGPQWREVIERLEWNGVMYTRLDHDSVIPVQFDRVIDYKTIDQPFEGHYLHYDIDVSEFSDTLLFPKGTCIVDSRKNQDKVKYLMNVLMTDGKDSFFAWNFFDSHLQQKEWYSSYVFEDKAVELLKNDPSLMEAFEAAKEQDPDLATDRKAQLYWVYTHSDFYEPEHMRIPVFRTVD